MPTSAEAIAEEVAIPTIETYTVKSGDSMSSIVFRFYGKYDPAKVEKIRQANLGKSTGRGRIVYCIELDQQWDSVYQAQKETNIRHISEVLNGERKTAGKHPVTGEKLHWIEIFNT